MTPRQTKLAIVVTAAICLPLGALTQRQASAQKVLNDIDPSTTAQRTSHFEAAQLAMHTAWNEINASRRADENVWHDDAGHGANALELIEHALHATDGAASWAQLDSAPGHRGLLVVHRVDP